MSEPIYKQVMKDVEARAEGGKKTYGRYLMADANGRDPVQDAYEEALDMAHYLKQVGHDRRALIEYVARLEGAVRYAQRQFDSHAGEDIPSEIMSEVLATSPLTGQPHPAPATGWRPIAEAPETGVVFAGMWHLGKWYDVLTNKSRAIEENFTHFFPLPAPPKEGE